MENSPHHVPAVFHMEGLCGPFIQNSVSLPSGIARGSSWDPELEESLGKIVSRQELSCGITQVLAPVLDISRDSRMAGRAKHMGKTRHWRQRLELLIRMAFRREKRLVERRNLLQSIFLDFIIPREESMGLTVTFRKDS